MNCILKTKRLTLRPLNLSDLETVHQYASDTENTKYIIRLPNYSIEETKAFLVRIANEWKKDDPSFYEFAIDLDNRHIGAVSVYLDDERAEGELGWIIHKQFWGNGYATEAAFALKEFCVNELKLKKLKACCDNENVQSIKVIKKLGMELVDDNIVRRYIKTAVVSTGSRYSVSINL